MDALVAAPETTGVTLVCQISSGNGEVGRITTTSPPCRIGLSAVMQAIACERIIGEVGSQESVASFHVAAANGTATGTSKRV